MEGDEGTYECSVMILESHALSVVEITSLSGKHM